MEYFNEPEFQDPASGNAASYNAHPVDVLEPIVAEANRGQHTKRTKEYAWAFRGSVDPKKPLQDPITARVMGTRPRDSISGWRRPSTTEDRFW